MMQATQSWYGNDFATQPGTHFCFTPGWSFLCQSEVSAVFMVVADIVPHEALQMVLVKRDDMIEKISAAVSDKSLRYAILPWALKAGSLWLYGETLDRLDNLTIEVSTTVEDQVFRRAVVREGFAQLLDHPSICRVLGHIEVKDSPPVVRDDREAVQQTERHRRHSEEIHGGNPFAVIAEKGRPPLCRLRIARRFPHPAENGALGDFVPEHLQFTVNARRARGGVLRNHAEDEFAKLSRCRFPANAAAPARDPFPIHFESCAMPANDGVGLDDQKSLSPISPEAPQENPEHAIMGSQARTRMLRCQGRKLLSECEVLQKQISPRAKE
jgi:hypothetical protein